MNHSRSSSARSALLLAQLCLVLVGAPAHAVDVIVPSKGLPSSSPWDLKKLSETPQFEWIEAEGPARALLYEGEPYDEHSTHVFAYYASPKTLGLSTAKDEKFPAIVLLHGGGGTAFREWAVKWAKNGYAAIAMDLTGSRPIEGLNAHDMKNRKPLEDAGANPSITFNGVDKPPAEQWPYHAVAAGVRAHSLLRSFPEVDADRTAVTGISWGGYLTLITAAVDTRFKAAVPVYGCGHLLENSAWLQHFAKMTPEQRNRWAKLWDPSVYVPAIQMPIFFINGTNDGAYPLDSYMKTYAAVRAPKQLRITIKMPHSHTDGWAPNEIGRFVDQQLRGGPALPAIGKVKNADGKIVAKFSANGAVKANLNFTSDRGPINKREWQTKAGTASDGTITVDQPSPDVTAWFLTITDDEATTSSEVFFGPSVVHPAVEQAPEDPALPRVLLIGDSISMGYTGPVRNLFASIANVQHPADNCGSSRRIVERLDQYLGDKTWDVIHFNSGIHDLTLMNANDKATDAEQGGTAQVPLDEYRDNLEKIITRLKQTGASLIWCTTTPIGKPARFRKNSDVDRYNEVADEVMRRHELSITDLNGIIAERGTPKLSHDGVHFTDDGYRELADYVAPAIQRALDAREQQGTKE